MKEQAFAKIATNQVEVKTLKILLDKMPVQIPFKQGLKDYLETKGLFKHELCSSLVLGVAFAEYANKTVDPNSDESMRDFHVALAILGNPKKLPTHQSRSKE